MNKFFATIALAALAFTSCIKENNSYEEIRPVLPGQSIYQYGMNQNILAMVPANAGMRLAMLLAEAAKQNPGTDLADIDLGTIIVSNKKVQDVLFRAGTKIERQTNGDYKITYDESIQMHDGLYMSGSILVVTNGVELLSDTGYGSAWSVEMQNLQGKLYGQTGMAEVYKMESGATRIYSDGGDSYHIEVSSFRASVNESSFSSNWGGSFTLTPEDASLAYSLCAGKLFNVEGSASGPTLFSQNNITNLGMSYELTEGRYQGLQIVSGTQECRFTSYADYDTAVYPSPTVTYVWTLDTGANTYYWKIYYNGYVYPKD